MEEPKAAPSIPEHTFILKYWKFILPVIFIGAFLIYVLKDLPSPIQLSSNSIPQSTQVFDRHGVLLYSFHGEKNQTFIPISAIPKTLQQATIAIEDKDFYRHGAIDLRGIFRAMVSIAFHHRIQGGSTITQQLVKNSLLSPEQTIPRKVKEVLLSFATELLYPKDKILELYLNQIPYGGTTWGIEAAAQTYFGKKAKKLTLAESAFLAGLPEQPTVFSPFGAHPELGKKRQETVLQVMREQGYITKKQEQDAVKAPLAFKKFDIKAPHFVFYIRDLLINKYGEKKVLEGGLKVTTSLDLGIQDMAQATVSAEIEGLTNYHVTNGAALVTKPGTGEILAMVGSSDYNSPKGGAVNLTDVKRQPGSSIKPINYAVGLIHGYTGATPFVDKPTCFSGGIGVKGYCPENYDRKWHGLVQMRYALGNSLNIPAVKMLKVNTVPAMIATAEAMGINTFNDPDSYGLPLTLGAAEVKMTELVTAYGVFANGGYRVDLHPILKVTDHAGKVLESYTPLPSPIFGRKVLPEGVAFIMSDMLSDNNARLIEFGSNSSLVIAKQIVSVKTGTTDEKKDNWTIGYTPSYAVGVWVGNNDNTPMNQAIASGITGAAPIWHDIMSELLGDNPPEALQRPTNVIQKSVCSTTGYLPSDNCPTRFEYFIKGTEPKQTNPGMQDTWIDNTTQNIPRDGQTDNISMKPAQIITDPTGDKYCLSCPVQNP